jgi:hypothetical protein
MLAISHSLTHTIISMHKHPQTKIACTHTHTHSLSLTHTHSLSLTHTHIRTYTHAQHVIGPSQTKPSQPQTIRNQSCFRGAMSAPIQPKHAPNRSSALAVSWRGAGGNSCRFVNVCERNCRQKISPRSSWYARDACLVSSLIVRDTLRTCVRAHTYIYVILHTYIHV